MGNIRRFVKVPFAHGGGGGASGAARTGGGRVQKGARMSEIVKARSFSGTNPTGRSSTPRERGDTLRQAINREKAIKKTHGSVIKSEDRIFLHTSGEKRMSTTKLRREGRLQRNLRGRLEELDPVRSIPKKRKSR